MENTSPDESVTRWQGKLDRDFPHGLLASWSTGEDRESPEGNYQVPRAEVVGTAGEWPVVALPSPAWGKTVTVTLTSYEIRQTKPCLVARVGVEAVAGSPAYMLWSAGLGEPLTTIMAPDRANYIEASQKLGRSVLA